MPIKIIIDDSKGLYQQYDASSGGVVGIKQTRSASGIAAGDNGLIVSDAITIPANSLITNYHAVVTSQLVFAAASDVGIRFGNSSAGTDDTYVALVADGTATGVATLDVGQGNSTNTAVSTSLDAANENTALTAVAGAQKIGAADVDIYGSLVAVEDIDAGGTVQFVVEFITFS